VKKGLPPTTIEFRDVGRDKLTWTKTFTGPVTYRKLWRAMVGILEPGAYEFDEWGNITLLNGRVIGRWEIVSGPPLSYKKK